MGLAELKGYPIVNQLNNPTLNSKPDENKFWNCTIACLLSMILYYHPEFKGKISDDSIKDSVLGEAWVNRGTDAAWFVNYAAQHGVKLSSQRLDTTGQQVMFAHKMLQSGIPCILTESDPYCTAYQRDTLGWLHACVFIAETPDGLQCMDPFGGHIVQKSNAGWIKDLRGTVLWIAEKLEQPQALPAITIPQGWLDDGQTLMTPDRRFRAMHGMRDTILKSKWNPANILASGEYPDGQGNIYQDCVFCTLVYTQKDGTVSLMEGDAFSQHLWHIINTQDAIISHDKAVVTSLQQQVDNSAAQLQNAQNRLLELQASMNTLASQHELDTKTILEVQDTLTQAQKDNGDLQIQLAQSKGDVQADTLKITELENENTKLQVQLNALQQAQEFPDSPELLTELEALVTKYHPL